MCRVARPFALLLLASAAALWSSGCQSHSGAKGSSSHARGGNGSASHAPALWEYPETRSSAQIDDYHGTVVADPYRWLEDQDSDETRAWVERQNRLSFGYLESIPERETIRKRLTSLWNYERFGVPRKKGGRYFFTRNDGLQNQSVLYVKDSAGGEARVLLDPNRLSEDGTIALGGSSFSDDGRWLAYALAEAGSDWRTWRVRDVATGRDTEDRIEWTKFGSVSWARDHSGFYYGRYPEPPEGDEYEAQTLTQKLYFHRLGDPQSADELVYERPEHPTWSFGPTVTEDGRWLVITGFDGTDRRSRVWYRDLQSGGPVQPLLTAYDASYYFIGNDGETWFFQTNKDAPRSRVIAVNLSDPSESRWRELIPEDVDTLRSVSYLNHSLVVNYLHDAHSRVAVFGLDGTSRYELELPVAYATVSGLSGNHDQPEAFYSMTSFTTPATTYALDLETGRSKIFNQPQVDFDAGDYVVKQVWYTSQDGTPVPMFLVHRKNLLLNGQNPVLLYGYGGFNIPLTPSFSVANSVWLEMGGIYAMPNLRGGGEYGREWHQAGTIHEKQNVFDDFIAAAEWLIENDYTTSHKLAIAGGSNGGLLVGACMTQRPDLFGATLPAVGVLDMLRYHKFTVGWAWVSDYGSSEDPAQFESLLAYSPVHNVRPGVHYPATLVTTGDHDDRVVPSHSYKFAAALQKAQGGPEPVLIRIETRAGHGAGKPTSKRIEEATDRWAFLVDQLEVATATR